jgi:hypothetical protein
VVLELEEVDIHRFGKPEGARPWNVVVMLEALVDEVLRYGRMFPFFVSPEWECILELGMFNGKRILGGSSSVAAMMLVN